MMGVGDLEHCSDHRRRMKFVKLPLETLPIDLSGPRPERISKMHLSESSNEQRWSIVSLLFAASLINYLDRAAISFALPLISIDFRLTAQSKGLLLSSFFWSYALMQIPIGWCADRFNLARQQPQCAF